MTNCIVFLMDRNIWDGAGLLEGNASVFLVFQSVISCGKHREQKKEENLLTMFDWVSVKHLEEYWLCYEKALT